MGIASAGNRGTNANVPLSEPNDSCIFYR